MLTILTLLACSEPGVDTGDVEPFDPGPNPYTLDDLLRLDHVQAKATHNSYHQEPETTWDDSHEYTHASLDVQAADHGVRGFEIDLHYREDVGFEVFHLPAIDPESSCVLFTDCLEVLKQWSDANYWHIPLMIWLEPKDGDADLIDATLLPFVDKHDEIESDILSVWPRDRIFTPDDLRSSHADLPTALAAEGWPVLGELRGHIMFAMLDTGEHRDAYLSGSDVLEGRLLFVDSSDSTDPFAAMWKDAGPTDGTALAQAGLLVTTNVSSIDDDDAAAADELAAHLASGIHFLADDRPAPVEGRDYWMDLPDGAPVRCNPITAPVECTAEDLEKL
jgi:hypothetical protein